MVNLPLARWFATSNQKRLLDNNQTEQQQQLAVRSLKMASKDLELGCMPEKLHCDADMGSREDISESSESEYEDEVLAEKLNELKDLVRIFCLQSLFYIAI